MRHRGCPGPPRACAEGAPLRGGAGPAARSLPRAGRTIALGGGTGKALPPRARWGGLRAASSLNPREKHRQRQQRAGERPHSLSHLSPPSPLRLLPLQRRIGRDPLPPPLPSQPMVGSARSPASRVPALPPPPSSSASLLLLPPSVPARRSPRPPAPSPCPGWAPARRPYGVQSGRRQEESLLLLRR